MPNLSMDTYGTGPAKKIALSKETAQRKASQQAQRIQQGAQQAKRRGQQKAVRGFAQGY